jgi:hypothetical protein
MSGALDLLVENGYSVTFVNHAGRTAVQLSKEDQQWGLTEDTATDAVDAAVVSLHEFEKLPDLPELTDARLSRWKHLKQVQQGLYTAAGELDNIAAEEGLPELTESACDGCGRPSTMHCEETDWCQECYDSFPDADVTPPEPAPPG